MARLEEEIAKHEKSVADVTKQASKLEADVAAVQKEIDDVGGLELKLQKNITIDYQLVKGANHFFKDHMDHLTNSVNAYLDMRMGAGAAPGKKKSAQG